MKKIIVFIILSNFISLVFSQNLKVLDLSNGGLRIPNITVEKIETNQFVIICDSSLAISQVILNAGKRDLMKVKKDGVVPILYEEQTTNYTNFRLSQNDTLQLFVFENGHNYQIEHNNKTWNIIVRKRKSLQTDLFLEDTILHIGADCITIRDTMHIALIDSLILSKWDRQFSLFKNGVRLKDSLCITVDDKYCYYFKTILSDDSIIHVDDTLRIYQSNKDFYLVVFEKTDAPPSLPCLLKKYWWWLLALIFIFLLIIKYRKIFIERFPWLKNNMDSDQVPNDENPDVLVSNVSKVDIKQESWCQLNKLLDELFKIIPKKVNGSYEKEFIFKKDNIDNILIALIKKCDEIHQFVNDSHIILTEDPISAQDLVYVYPDTSEKKDTLNLKSEFDWFVDILSTIESLKIEGGDTRKEGLNLSTIEHIKADFLLLGKRIQKELRIAKNRENEEVSRSWQIRYDSLSASYKELQESYNKDVLAASDKAKRNAVDALNEIINELKKRNRDAEEKAQTVEKSKNAAIADAVKKVQESHEKEIKKLKENEQKAEERAQLAEESKMKAIADAVQKEKEAHVKEEKRLREGKEKAEAELTRTIRSLEVTRKELINTKTDRDRRIIEIQQLEKAQEQFTRSLSSVPFAEMYSKQVYELLKLGSQIQTAAYSILDSNVEDPYFIMKAISKYGKMIDGIDMKNFLIDVSMISKANFVFKDSSLATFKEDNKDIDNIVRSYFFNQYLEKYINAIMVLNESMSGLKLLLPEVQSKVITFDKYREEILFLAKKLKVAVLFVKVGDMAGENIDLKAKTVDVEIGKPGQILEIENCIVYPIDNRKPQTKIKVIIKK